jgi:hypothetical protein
MSRKTLIAGLTAFLLAGCVGYELVSYDPTHDFLDFDLPFTDKAFADVHAKAGQLCARRKKEAVQTTKACSLTKCTTSYKCVDKADAANYR